MTIRQFWIVILVVSVLTVARGMFGEVAMLVYFVIVGAIGIGGTIGFYRRRQRIAKHLVELSELERDQTLVFLENNQLRPGLVAELALDEPRVPLRGGREVFRYPADISRTSRWTMYACAWLALFIAVGSLSDWILNTQRFVGPSMSWWEVPALVAGFSAATGLMWWNVRETRGELEITDEAITWTVPGRAPRRIGWHEVTMAKLREVPPSIRLRSRTQRITVSEALTDIGRVINLIATRLPPSTTRQAS